MITVISKNNIPTSTHPLRAEEVEKIFENVKKSILSIDDKGRKAIVTITANQVQNDNNPAITIDINSEDEDFKDEIEETINRASS
jgi:hypothetical protein